jgi:hypothetical protein
MVPFVKTGRTELRAVTITPKEHAKKAQGYLRQAKNVGAMATMGYPGASKLQTKQEINLVLLAAEQFRIAGEQHWVHSAHAYAQAAALTSGAMMDSSKSAELYAEAALVIEKVGTDFANDYYSKHDSIVEQCTSSDAIPTILFNFHFQENLFRSTVTHRSTKMRHCSKSA